MTEYLGLPKEVYFAVGLAAIVSLWLYIENKTKRRYVFAFASGVLLIVGFLVGGEVGEDQLFRGLGCPIGFGIMLAIGREIWSRFSEYKKSK